MKSISIRRLSAGGAVLAGDPRYLLPHGKQRRACIRLYREEKLPAAIAEWRSVLQYEPGHEGAKRNIEQAERLLKGLEARQQKQGR